MKQISVKQAQKWLDKLKNEDLQAYKDITKYLRKYQKTEDEYDCFVKLNTTLLNHSKLTQQLNQYMEDGNKMVINRPQEEKIKDFIAFIKKNRPGLFSDIINIIQNLTKKSNITAEETNALIITEIKKITKDDTELIKLTQQSLEMTGEQLIARLDLEHLKMNKVNAQMLDQYEEEISKQKIPRAAKKEAARAVYEKESAPQQKPQRAIPFASITSVDDEKFIFRHLEKTLDPKLYLNMVKILKIYYLNIITKNQAIQLVSALPLEEELDFLKDIIDTRQADRRRLSVFKPLNDLDFSNCERPSPSYVSMPISYPNRCHSRNQFFKQFLNDTFVSVPHGSQENFNVRFKNSNQINLLKSQDQRYQFDLYMNRLHKSHSMLQKILNPKSQPLSEQKILSMINKIISMGIVQLIYKNCNKEQKEQLEWHLKNNQQECLRIFMDRIHFQIKEMESIKSIHAIRAWYEVAHKNFGKALDLKGFEFKKNQKEKIKSTSFVAELHERANNLHNGGEAKLHLLIPFQDRREFFQILNSFEASSRTQRCLHRELPQIQTYDLHDQRHRKYYPVMIFAFQNKGICQKVYSLIHFYIDSYAMGDSEKIRCKLFLENFLINYLGWQQPTKRFLNDNFDEEKLFAKINNSLEEHLDLTTWIGQVKEEQINNGQAPQNLHTLATFHDVPSEYGYLPHKSANNQILYGSEQLYSLLRFIYTLYERIIKMEEIAQYQQKIILFQLLFYACIKAKQGVRFEQNLNLIFGKHAYLFSTIYKLCDNLVRSLSAVSTCLITAQSIRLSKLQSEEIYLLMLNKFCLSNQLSNSKLVRFVYEPKSTVIYVNLLDSFYKIEENPKDLYKKRNQINKGIEIYTLDSWEDGQIKKKRKLNEIIQVNNQQYIFEGSTIKMLNHLEKEDWLCFVGKNNSFAKNLKRELKRVSKINSALH